MSAEGLLDNPALFSSTQHTKNRLSLALEYLELATRHGPVAMKCVIFHVRRIAREQLQKYQLMQECCSAPSIAAVQTVLEQCARYDTGVEPFVYEPLKEQKAQREVGKKPCMTDIYLPRDF